MSYNIQSNLPVSSQGPRYFAPTLQSRGYIVRQTPVPSAQRDYQAPQCQQFLRPQTQFNGSWLPTAQHSAYWPNNNYQTPWNQNYAHSTPVQPSFALQQRMPVNQQGFFNNAPQQAQWNNNHQWTRDQFYNYNTPQSLNASFCMYNELPHQRVPISTVNPGYLHATDPKSVKVLSKTAAPYTLTRKSKRMRTAFTSDQVEILEETFNKQSYISKIQRQSISRRLSLSDQAIKVWFQNRRMKGKRDVQELYDECDRSSSQGSSTSSVLDDFETKIQTPNEDGFVTVSDEDLNKLFDIVQQHIPDDMMFDLLNENVESTISEEPTGPKEQENKDWIGSDIISEELIPCESEVTVTDCAEITPTVPIYEPISPPEFLNETFEAWAPTDNNTNLQSLFDIHFC